MIYHRWWSSQFTDATEISKQYTLNWFLVLFYTGLAVTLRFKMHIKQVIFFLFPYLVWCSSDTTSWTVTIFFREFRADGKDWLSSWAPILVKSLWTFYISISPCDWPDDSSALVSIPRQPQCGDGNIAKKWRGAKIGKKWRGAKFDSPWGE